MVTKQLNLIIRGAYSDHKIDVHSAKNDYESCELYLHNVSSILVKKGVKEDENKQELVIRCDGKDWRLIPNKNMESAELYYMIREIGKYDTVSDYITTTDSEIRAMTMDLNTRLGVSEFFIFD